MLKEIPLEELSPSPTNPRKHFDAVKIEELAGSIREKGVLEPLLVRPHRNGGPAKFEVVAGERRRRAAGIAEAKTVPCIVRDLTDIEVLEIQTIENLQRDDVHPLEEAQGYADLMKAAGYDVARIAQRIGKEPPYVYDRMKLLQLIPALEFWSAQAPATGSGGWSPVRFYRIRNEIWAHLVKTGEVGNA